MSLVRPGFVGLCVKPHSYEGVLVKSNCPHFPGVGDSEIAVVCGTASCTCYGILICGRVTEVEL